MGRPGGYRGLAKALAVTVTLGTALTAMTSCSAQGPAAPVHPTPGHPTPLHPTTGQPTPGHPTTGTPATGHPTTGTPTPGHPTTGTPTALPQASCGGATTHQLSGATQVFRADAGALSCFAAAARQCQSASIAITEMGVDTGTKYVFAIAPGKANCPATEWSQGYSANFGGSKQFKVVVAQCSTAARPDGVTLGCGSQDILIPVTVTT